ncbi:WD40 repeat-like protein [Sistotremastrum niveocremeum HHB9708]|uniref:Probable cytosolic iron-sulfur protein assembly protein 1 n=1 Tax=Sistotremastrum niveocremeum HHB9708 TaxID=1314777 RepID=A0A164Q2P6_9AGAM|nr:WD40 repeat-like protein [Sistotremastrum niveocremeum HHB9708]
MPSSPEIKYPYRLEQIAELTGHEDKVWSISWNPHPDHPLLASCSSDKSIRLYAYSPPSTPSSSPSTGSERKDKESEYNFRHVSTIATGHSKTVRSIAWTNDGRTLASASFDSTVGLWERSPSNADASSSSSAGDDVGGNKELGVSGEWELTTTLEGPDSEIKSVAFSTSSSSTSPSPYGNVGGLVATCSRDKSVWIWENVGDGEWETVSVIMGVHSQDVKCLAWYPGEDILASGSYDDTIKLYIDDPQDDWYDFATLEGHTSTVWSLAWEPLPSPSSSTRYLASASDDKSLRIWARTDAPKKGVLGHVNSSDQRWECVKVLKGHERSVYSVSWGHAPSFAADAGWIASTGSDDRINIWSIKALTNPTSHVPLVELIASREDAHGIYDLNAVAWAPHTTTGEMEGVLASCGDDGVVRVWKVVKND